MVEYLENNSQKISSRREREVLCLVHWDTLPGKCATGCWFLRKTSFQGGGRMSAFPFCPLLLCLCIMGEFGDLEDIIYFSEPWSIRL